MPHGAQKAYADRKYGSLLRWIYYRFATKSTEDRVAGQGNRGSPGRPMFWAKSLSEQTRIGGIQGLVEFDRSCIKMSDRQPKPKT